MSDIRTRLKQYIDDEEKAQEQARLEAEKTNKSVGGTLSGGLQLFGQGILKGAEGIFVDLPTQLAAGAMALTGQKDKAKTLSEFARWDLTNAAVNKAGGYETNPYINQNQNLYNKDVLNKSSYVTDENFGGKLVQGIGEMIPTIAIGGTAGKAAANVALGGKAFASGYNEAFGESGDVGKSTLYGLLTAGTELATEQISGGIPGLKQIEGTTKKEIVKNYIKDAIGEGVEEVVSELVNPLTQTVYKGSESLSQYGTGDFWGGVIESGLLGMTIGGALDSPNLRGVRASSKASKSLTSSKPSTGVQEKKSNASTNIESDLQIKGKNLPLKTATDANVGKTTDTTKTTTNSQINTDVTTKPATKTTTESRNILSVENGKIVDSDGKEVTFMRLHPDYKNITDNFDYNTTKYSHNTGFGLTFMDNDSYIKGKPAKDVLKSTIRTDGLLTSDSKVTVSDAKINDLNKIINDKQLDIPEVFTHGDTESDLIDKINMASNMVAENIDNNAGRETYKMLYKVIGKDGYLLTNPDGSHTLSVVSKNNIDALYDKKSTTQSKKPTKATKEDIAHLFGEDKKKTLNKQEVEKKETRTEKIEEIKKEVKEATKRELPTVKETSKVTPIELNETFDKISEAYKEANTYPEGEYRDDALKPIQKQYNEYRAKGGDKIISSLEEEYKTKTILKQAGLNKEVKKDMFNPAQANTQHMMMSSDNRIRQVEKQIASKSSKAAKDAEVARIVEEYEAKVAKGMDTIEYYENLKKQYGIHETVNDNISDKKVDVAEIPVIKETAADIKLDNDMSLTGNAVMDEAIGIDDELIYANDSNEYMDMLDDDDVKVLGDTLMVKSRNSAFNTEYNEKQNKIKQNAKVTVEEHTELEDTRQALYKKEQYEKKAKKEGITAFVQRFLDQFKSLRDIDTANGDHKIMAAMNRRNHKNNIAAQSFFGSNMISYKGEWMNTLSGSKALEDYTNLQDNLKPIADMYMRLQQDAIDKINHRDYSLQFDNEYVNNIFPDNSIEDNVELINDIEEEYSELVSVIKNNIIPKLSEYNYAMNKQLIASKILPEYTTITKDVAKDIMEMTDDEITAATVNKKIKVNTADYFYKMNPWYSPITREVVKKGTGVSNRADLPVGKLKGRVEGAEQYNIQPLNQSLAERAFSNYSKMIENDFRRTVAENYAKVADVKTVEYKTVTGETKELNVIDGQYEMTYLDSTENGNVVTKKINITKNMYDAMSGIDAWAKSFKQSTAGKIMSKKASIQKAMLTKLNLPWQGSNFIRDFSDAIINSEFTGREMARFMKNEFSAFIIDAKANTPEYQTFMANRGEYLTQTETKGFIQKKTPLENALNKMNNALEVSELTTRYALYKTALQSGYSIDEAMRLSNEGTTDFSKTGSLWRSLDSAGLTVFLGSSVAGVNRFIDTAVTPYTNLAKEAINKAKYGTPINSKTTKRAITQAVKTALIFGLGRELLKKLYDDEESQKAIANLSDTEIRDNIIIPVGDGVIKIPKGRIWRAADAIEDIMSGTTIRDEDKLNVVDTINYVWDSVGVNGLDSSTSFSTFMNIMKNEDYYGNEIYQNGQVVSKDTFDYLLKQYGSVYYNTFRYVNGSTEINPWVSKFYTDTNTVSAYNSRFYNMKDAYENLKPNADGSFNSDEDMANYFAWRVLNYEKTNGELGKELKVLQSLKNDYASNVDDIRAQEDKVKRIYSDVYSYIDNNKAIDYVNASGDKVIKAGDNYTYKLEKKDDGTYSYTKVRTKK